MKTCLDLFSGLGGFSAAFVDSDDWRVVTVDIDERFDPDIRADVLELRPGDLPNADVIVASPECKDFSLACMNRKWNIDETRSPAYLPAWETIPQSIHLVFHTLWLMNEISPDYWFLENPRWGALCQFIGKPEGTVHYCQYDTKFKKPTALWGNHPPMEYRKCPGKPPCNHLSNPSEQNTYRDVTRLADVEKSAERAKVPWKLSKSILESVERAYQNPPPEQTTLEDEEVAP